MMALIIKDQIFVRFGLFSRNPMMGKLMIGILILDFGQYQFINWTYFILRMRQLSLHSRSNSSIP